VQTSVEHEYASLQNAWFTASVAGQVAVVPVQVSATSHSPFLARQTVEDDLNPLTGHDAELPGHDSGKSHGRGAGRQTVVKNTSVGQAAPVPSHDSATSHSPATERQTPPVTNPSTGQVAVNPVQYSTWSQIPLDARHGTVDNLNELPGHVVLAPVQLSARSQNPAASRHTRL